MPPPDSSAALGLRLYLAPGRGRPSQAAARTAAPAAMAPAATRWSPAQSQGPPHRGRRRVPARLHGLHAGLPPHVARPLGEEMAAWRRIGAARPGALRRCAPPLALPPAARAGPANSI